MLCAFRDSGGGIMANSEAGITKLSSLTKSLWFLLPVVVALCILLVGILARITPLSHLGEMGAASVAFAVYVVISLALACVPILISHVQTTTRDREKAKLESLEGHSVANTMYYQKALASLWAIRPAQINNSDYTVPIITFWMTLFFGWMFVMAGVFWDFTVKNVILGGISLQQGAASEVASYQIGTYICMSAGFISCYIYVIVRLLDRINNNDIYPITFYYYTVRLISVLIIAAVLRHTLKVTDVNVLDTSNALVIFGFAVGYAPDLFFAYIVGKALELIKQSGTSRVPDRSTVPTEMPLLMIEGLSKGKIDRLNELSIDSAQVLGCQNPFSIWPRLPYDLGLVVDWIAQAMLYALVKETILKNLREKLVTDIFDFYERLLDKETRPQICAVIGIDANSACGLIHQLENDQSFLALLEVRTALQPSAKPARPAHTDEP